MKHRSSSISPSRRRNLEVSSPDKHNKLLLKENFNFKSIVNEKDGKITRSTSPFNYHILKKLVDLKGNKEEKNRNRHIIKSSSGKKQRKRNNIINNNNNNNNNNNILLDSSINDSNSSESHLVDLINDWPQSSMKINKLQSNKANKDLRLPLQLLNNNNNRSNNIGSTHIEQKVDHLFDKMTNMITAFDKMSQRTVNKDNNNSIQSRNINQINDYLITIEESNKEKLKQLENELIDLNSNDKPNNIIKNNESSPSTSSKPTSLIFSNESTSLPPKSNSVIVDLADVDFNTSQLKYNQDYKQNQIKTNEKSSSINLVLSKLEEIEKNELEAFEYLKNIDNDEEFENEIKKDISKKTNYDIPNNDIIYRSYDRNLKKSNDSFIPKFQASNVTSLPTSSKSNYYTSRGMKNDKNFKIDHDVVVFSNPIDEDVNENWCNVAKNSNKGDNIGFDEDKLNAPPFSRTFETSLRSTQLPFSNNEIKDKNYITALNGLYNQEDRTIKEINIQREIDSKKLRILKSSLQVVNISPEFVDDFSDYFYKFKANRKLKEVAFNTRGLSLSDAADKIADRITEDIINGVTGEIDEFVNEYAERFLDKI
jgi:hypothetical protein